MDQAKVFQLPFLRQPPLLINEQNLNTVDEQDNESTWVSDAGNLTSDAVSLLGAIKGTSTIKKTNSSTVVTGNAAIVPVVKKDNTVIYLFGAIALIALVIILKK